MSLDVLHDRDMNDIAEHIANVDELVAKLRGLALSKATLHNLFHFFRASGHYAHAEDILFTLIELDTEDKTVNDDGIGFYEMLRGKSDAELVAGNLPRDEVESGLQELLAL